MTNTHTAILTSAHDERFADVAKAMGYEIWGPSKHGSFLLRDEDGRAWLFSALRRSGAIASRTVVPSAITPLNIAVMTGQSTEGL